MLVDTKKILEEEPTTVEEKISVEEVESAVTGMKGRKLFEGMVYQLK